jgi:predicted O-linked N-acetylglucosamine transferase (SPINDLY family)
MVLQALQLHQSGQIKQAHGMYVSALQANPRDAHALHFLGVLMHQTGNSDDALLLLTKATEIEPDLTDAWCNLGNIQRDLTQFTDARVSYDKALSLEPGLAEIWNSLGNLHQQTGVISDAEVAYRKALELQPESAEACYNLATILAISSRWEEAAEWCEKAIKLAPGRPEPYGQLADVYLNQNQTEYALEYLRAGLKIDPRHPDLQYNLGFALSTKGDLPASKAAYQQALVSNPNHAAALSALLYVKRQLADWSGIDELSSRLAAGLELGWQQITPFSFLAEPFSRRQQLNCARLWTENVQQRVGQHQISTYQSREGEHLTIGYLSADYYRHPTAYLAAGLFEHHDREQFRVIAYSNSRDDDSGIRKRLEKAFDEFLNIRSMSPAKAAERICADGVDILVDLKGHTLEAATAVMALRPAPIQVNYLGYPGSMGAEYIDYIIGDRFVTPFADQDDYDEHIVQLPGSYQVNDIRRPRPSGSPGREAFGLPADGIVFCCFNNSWKITREMFACWMDILKAVPNGVLWLHGRQSLEVLRENLQAEMQKYDVEPSRLVIAEPKPLDAYLQQFLEADIFLDTLPYNAHTTASDALWMACPVITISGDTFPSRVGASLLSAVELPQLICKSMEEYKQMATDLANNSDQLSRLQQHLQQGRDRFPLFDTRTFTRNLEQAYKEMNARLKAKTKGAFSIEA